jgi:hypothetical protein
MAMDHTDTGAANTPWGSWNSWEEAISWGSWEEATFSCAKKHFDKFLGQLSDRDFEELGGGELGGRTYDTIMKENVSLRLMRRFATGYLPYGSHLRYPERGITRMQAERYLWSIQSHIRQDLQLANDAAMESIRREMVREFAYDEHLFRYLRL